jgi:hypothetical protein
MYCDKYDIREEVRIGDVMGENYIWGKDESG